MQNVKSTIAAKAGKFKIQELVEAVLEENRRLIQCLGDEAVELFIQRILSANSIFFAAQGRAGFILRCFCMRLMHLGFQVYFCGETITPAIGSDDLLIVLSGSGETASTLEAVRSAKEPNAITCGILGNLDSRIGALVNVNIHLPGTTKLCRDDEPHSLQMAGSLFEQSAFLFLEAVVLNLYQQRKNDVGRISSRHAVIE
ncbi:MAG: 6-phospho-3-hexuloisomerase [Pseudomonadota bacterium]